MDAVDGGEAAPTSAEEMATSSQEVEAKREEKRAAIRASIEATKAKQEEEKEEKVDERFAAFRIEPKKDEEGDKNFPPHLHAAAQLYSPHGPNRFFLQNDDLVAL
ncbi:hypothetical protein T484DRAFT_1786051 [Baffinella frigidus]|nr:hypothetical protein T484DRAFT_1786051 [Cryptophyta sp. CCMP2293]